MIDYNDLGFFSTYSGPILLLGKNIDGLYDKKGNQNNVIATFDCVYENEVKGYKIFKL